MTGSASIPTYQRAACPRPLKVGMLDSGFSPDVLAGWRYHYAAVSHAGYELDDEAMPSDGTGHGSFNLALFQKALSDHSAVRPELCLCRSVGGGHAISRLLTGLNWLVASGVEVVNIPAGIRGYSPVFLAAINRIRASGAIPVVSVGNEGPGSYRSPGCYSNVLSVGAHGSDLAPTSFSGSCSDSGFVTKPDLLAPGYRLSCPSFTGNRGQARSGTSQSTTLVTAGIIALMQEFPEIHPFMIESALCQSAQGQSGRARGPGRVVFDIHEARQWLKGTDRSQAGKDKAKHVPDTILPLPRYVDPRLMSGSWPWTGDQPLDLVLVYGGNEEFAAGLAALEGGVRPERVSTLTHIHTVLIQLDVRLLDRVLAIPGIRMISLGCDWQLMPVSPWPGG